MIAVFINFLIAYREQFILDQSELQPDSAIRLATNLCRGIGFIVIGNLYDNVQRPQRLTFLILVCLSIATLLVISPLPNAIEWFPAHLIRFPRESWRRLDRKVPECKCLCLRIRNAYDMPYYSIQLVPSRDQILRSRHMGLSSLISDPHSIRCLSKRRLSWSRKPIFANKLHEQLIPSLVMTCLYVMVSFVCLKFFYHHPSHI